MYGYSECFQTISLLAPSVQNLFADSWSRFPAPSNAEIINNKLTEELNFWSNRNFEYSNRLQETIKAIQYNSK